MVLNHVLSRARFPMQESSLLNVVSYLSTIRFNTIGVLYLTSAQIQLFRWHRT